MEIEDIQMFGKLEIAFLETHLKGRKEGEKMNIQLAGRLIVLKSKQFSFSM
jgi:hypothetical protein